MAITAYDGLFDLNVALSWKAKKDVRTRHSNSQLKVANFTIIGNYWMLFH